MKILIVDDDFVSRKKMEKIVSALGVCISAEDGKSAMDAFQAALYEKEYFDLVLLDISMPYKSGIEVLYEIRALEKREFVPKDKDTKVLIVTAHSDKKKVVMSIQAGCDGYLIKPFAKDTVFENIKKLFPSFNL